MRSPFLRRWLLVVLGIVLIPACSNPVDPGGNATLTVANVQNPQCVHSGGNVVCTFTAIVTVSNYTFKNTTATFVTTDLLVGQWTPQSGDITKIANPSGSVAFQHLGVVCTGPETTLAVYDGFMDTGTLVASTQLNPSINLVCK